MPDLVIGHLFYPMGEKQVNMTLNIAFPGEKNKNCIYLNTIYFLIAQCKSL